MRIHRNRFVGNDPNRQSTERKYGDARLDPTKEKQTPTKHATTSGSSAKENPKKNNETSHRHRDDRI